MAHFYTYETVEIPLKFTPSGVLEGYRHIVVSLKQSSTVQINKTEDDLGIDIANDEIIVSLSQEETGQFNSDNPRKVEIQVNIYYTDTSRDVTCKAYIDVYDNLYKKVITDEHA